MEDKEEARAKLLEYLRLISSHYVGITSVDLGSVLELDRVEGFEECCCLLCQQRARADAVQLSIVEDAEPLTGLQCD